MVPRIEPQLLTAVLRGWRNGARGVKDAKDVFVVADWRGVSTVAPAWAPEREPTSTSSEIEDFASKILSEMRGRKGEEKQVTSEESTVDSGSSYLSELSMRGLKARPNDDAQIESPFQKLSQLGRLGEFGQGPGYMFLPPKEHLLEKFYSDENKSSMERHKLDLQKVREEYRIHEADCGSSQVQIALLTAKIKYMADHMKTHKKDLHSRKGLEGMIEQRKKLLKYLRRTDWDAYCILITRLGLRDKPNETR